MLQVDKKPRDEQLQRCWAIWHHLPRTMLPMLTGWSGMPAGKPFSSVIDSRAISTWKTQTNALKDVGRLLAYAPNIFRQQSVSQRSFQRESKDDNKAMIRCNFVHMARNWIASRTGTKYRLRFTPQYCPVQRLATIARPLARTHTCHLMPTCIAQPSARNTQNTCRSYDYLEKTRVTETNLKYISNCTSSHSKSNTRSR